MTDVIEPRTCPIEGHLFTPIPRRDGSLPEACRRHIRAFNGLQRRGVLPPAFRAEIARRKVDADRRRRERLVHDFGMVTDRELAIFEAGVDAGYAIGHNAAYARRRKGPTS